MNYYSIITKCGELCFYKGLKQYSMEEFKYLVDNQKNEFIVGYLCAILKQNDSAYNLRYKLFSNLTMIYVDPNFRHQGIGNNLLNIFINYCKIANVKQIYLDDMSDNYRIFNKNLYIKNGFNYINNIGPEMILNL